MKTDKVLKLFNLPNFLLTFPLRRQSCLILFAVYLAICSQNVIAVRADTEKIPFDLPSQQELAKLQSAILYTQKGKIYFELFPDQAPWHVANLKYLSDKSFYKNLRFHIFHPEYLIQGGAPTSNPDSGPGYEIPAEFNSRKNVRGALVMSRRRDALNLERASHGSQFHILLSDQPHLDGMYTVIGRVIQGMQVADSLTKGDQILEFRVFVSE